MSGCEHGNDEFECYFCSMERTIPDLRQQLRAAVDRAERAEKDAEADNAEAIRARAERDAARAECERWSALAESAWGIIANAGGGNWLLESEEWMLAAERWRDRYHAALARPSAPEPERRPLPPEVLADALQDAVHEQPSVGRPAKSVKTGAVNRAAAIVTDAYPDCPCRPGAIKFSCGIHNPSITTPVDPAPGSRGEE